MRKEDIKGDAIKDKRLSAIQFVESTKMKNVESLTLLRKHVGKRFTTEQWEILTNKNDNNIN